MHDNTDTTYAIEQPEERNPQATLCPSLPLPTTISGHLLSILFAPISLPTQISGSTTAAPDIRLYHGRPITASWPRQSTRQHRYSASWVLDPAPPSSVVERDSDSSELDVLGDDDGEWLPSSAPSGPLEGQTAQRQTAQPPAETLTVVPVGAGVVSDLTFVGGNISFLAGS
ncbi:hypothetical protein CDD82_7831 [Ophiocordyceps australis]|uniref:Uncharacterized protein n=1 Tax=Ophiocordyceps australis TaxID=1399860 RepID=A0A2C5YNK7_9HYPO|nr:hypothetical protein CDD82_7831 [Ophiocordyceps australis]